MELRKDYLLNRWVIISRSRNKRPHEFKEDSNIYKEDSGPEKCYFCPGNEDETPEEIGRIADGKKWRVRWFPNKFPAVKLEGKYEVTNDDHFFTWSDGYGEHQVIVETPNHGEQITDFDEKKLVEILKVYANRIEDMRSRPHIKYVSVFKNHGRKAGTSIVHSHSQMISLNIIPHEVQIKLDALKLHEGCAYCKIIDIEKKSTRNIFENDSCIAIAPYASRYNMEVWIFPKNHYKRLNDFSEEDLMDLARCLRHVLGKLKELNVSFNMVQFQSPTGEDLHFHIEIMPRIATPAGFELGTGVYINAIPPEDAAAWYRGENKD